MDKFLETYNFPKLNQEEAKNLNRLIKTSEFEAVIKKFPAHKSPGPNGFTSEFYHHSQKTNTYPSHTAPKIQEQRRLPNSFYKASIILFPKPGKDTEKKDHYRPLSLININAKILHKLLANLIQQYIKKIIHHNQVGFIPGMQGWDSVYKSITTMHHITK